MHVEWDPRKTRDNLRKHGVTFEEAASAFCDSLAVTGADPDHSEGEDRMITSDELRDEYRRSDFKTLERGKYYERVKASSNVVVLDADVAAVFPNAAAVNAALHSLLDIAQKASGLSRRPSGPRGVRGGRS